MLRIGRARLGPSTCASSRLPIATSSTEVRAGRFREDLFYRLNGISLTIPPLRDRPSEIEPLANSFVAMACRQLERPPLTLAEETLHALRAHTWPGNVRELKNVIERAVVLCAESTIGPEYLPASLTSTKTPRASSAPDATATAEVDPERYRAQLESLERSRIVEALSRCDGNQTQAARLLGVSRRTLVAKLTELDLPRPRKRRRARTEAQNDRTSADVELPIANRGRMRVASAPPEPFGAVKSK